ncbi:4Fe-4S binding protein [Limnohabitans sp. Jir72]|uniref:4Fe-4S binding protein n=1 Tax=Limnohabitans sp. Jir72 TaxID=1977909 RepID=UPI001E34CA32|nr:4Fe-4S binding protein [Limnohabitans sp. Jir72]
MAKAFPAPLLVGEKDRDLPIWPILKQDLTSTTVVAYAYESIDLSPIPGFSGTPFNLLVALDTQGQFMDVRVISHHEPVFLDGLGQAPLMSFVDQYRGLSLKQSIKISTGQNNAANKTGSANVYIDGVAKATASVRILNQSLLAASLKVARAKLGYSEGRDPDLIAKIRPEVFQPMDWNALVRAGLVHKFSFKNRDINKAFAGTAGEGLDLEADKAPDETFTDLYAAHLNVPAVGRNLLSPERWAYLQQRLEPGDHALLLISAGRYPLVSENFVRGTVPDRITLKQSQLPIEIRDMDLDGPLQVPAALQDAQWRVFRVIAPAGLDPGQPLDFELHVTRSKGLMYAEVVHKTFPFSASLPDDYVQAASSDQKTWRTSWTERWPELLVLTLGLAVLAIALRNPPWLVRSAQRVKWFRNTYLLFTLVFIGWYAQGQLSVVNLTAVIQSVLAGRSLAFFLYDPMTVLLWAFVAVTFFVWGRGTFCGWLCPFGALQDLVSQLTRQLGLKWLRVPALWDQRLKRLKYVVLAAILLSACLSVSLTDALVEVEPFKTSITLNFVRAWPFVLWAVALVVLSSFFYKGYCRYLCPLGAGMGLLGRLRRGDWIARRSECGQPCQRCRSDCAYQAITPRGTVDYDECFQCLDCVVIYESDALCVPLMQQKKSARDGLVIPIVALPATPNRKMS